jgi:hypothetical protein
LSSFLARVLEGGRGHVAAIMHRGQDLGELRSDLEPVELARVLQHCIFGTLVIWSLSKPKDLDKWLDLTFETFWQGVAAESGSISASQRRSARKEKSS